MVQKHTKNSKTHELRTTEPYQGQSIEEKVRQTMESGAPIEAISPQLFTERKEGVRADTNIRTDKWDIAQTAMDSIATGIRQKRQERLTDKATATKSEMNVQA